MTDTRVQWFSGSVVQLHGLVVLSVVILALIGQVPDSQAGWVTCPPPRCS